MLRRRLRRSGLGKDRSGKEKVDLRIGFFVWMECDGVVSMCE